MPSAPRSIGEDGTSFTKIIAIVDGSNVAREGRETRLARLRLMQDALWEYDDKIFICDASLRHKFKNIIEKEIYEKMCQDKLYHQAPAGRRADDSILEYAEDMIRNGILPHIITRDRFLDYINREEFTWLIELNCLRPFSIYPYNGGEKIHLHKPSMTFNEMQKIAKKVQIKLKRKPKTEGFEYPKDVSNIKLLFISESPPRTTRNYFYNTENFKGKHGPHRSFFRDFMQGVGLIPFPIGDYTYNEEEILKEFRNNNYFLIDTSRVPLIYPDGHIMSKSEKVSEMLNWVDSLARQIIELEPEKVVFICSTNKKVQERIEGLIDVDMLIPEPLPYPGYGQVKRFIEKFPEGYKLGTYCC